MITESIILALSLALNAALLWLFRAPLAARLRRPDAGAQMQAARDGIADAISAGHSGGAVEKDDRDRLLAALDLAQRTVEDVMVHRSRMEMLDADTEPNLLISRVLASPHTRLPLWRGSPENILGVIHGKDLLRAVERFRREGDGVLDSVADLDILSVAMKPYFVPDTTPLDEQMRQFLKRRTHFALVVDEYGALRGLITLEDILEEIVGDITDEFDVVDKQPRLTPTDSGDYVVDGGIPIRDLNRMMEWNLPDDEATTLAGLVIHEAQAIPNEGQCFSFHGFRFEVTEKRDNRLTRLKLRPMQV
jgi:Mg2+/Co2+ transporter CorB